MKKRLLSLFLTFSMLLTFFPVGTVTVFASDSPMAYTDGFYQFILNADNTATITKYTGNEHMSGTQAPQTKKNSMSFQKMPEHTPCESFRVIPSESTFRKRSQSTPLPSPMILSRTNSLSPFQRMLWKRKAMIIRPQ